MSFWSGADPSQPSLSTGEGDLVSISIHVDPRELECLLEALARLDFPINPEIYHDAALVDRFADGTETTHAVTLVEFPAYEARLPQVRSALLASGFDPAILWSAGMWDAIHRDGGVEPAPPGAAYQSRRRLKHRAAAVA